MRPISLSVVTYGEQILATIWSAGDLKTIGWLLGSSLDRPVIDRTGLTGKSDTHMEFTPCRSATNGSTVVLS